MKLLYATSISFPSMLANRLQISAMAGQMYASLGTNFLLGVLDAPENYLAVPVKRMGRISSSIILAWRYLLLIRKGKFTHVFIREERLLFLLGLYLRLTGTKVHIVLEVHWLREGWRERVALHFANTFIAISNGLKEDLIRLRRINAPQILVSHDAVQLERFHTLSSKEELRKLHNFPEDKVVILYTGSFGHHHPWKGVDTMAESVNYANVDWQYIFVGGREDEISLLRKEFPSEQIEFRGHADSTLIPGMLKAADIVVIPNRKGYVLSEKYTSPLKLFEYMASGTPMVASNLPSIREIVCEHEAVFFEPNNPKSLADALRSVLSDYDAALERAERGRVLVTKFTWNQRTRKVLDFIRSQSKMKA